MVEVMDSFDSTPSNYFLQMITSPFRYLLHLFYSVMFFVYVKIPMSFIDLIWHWLLLIIEVCCRRSAHFRQFMRHLTAIREIGTLFLFRMYLLSQITCSLYRQLPQLSLTIFLYLFSVFRFHEKFMNTKLSEALYLLSQTLDEVKYHHVLNLEIIILICHDEKSFPVILLYNLMKSHCKMIGKDFSFF
jgi:hypothetical protein